MKSILKSLPLLFVLAFTLFSCSKEYKPLLDPNNGTGTSPLLGELTCSFNGSDFFDSDERTVTDLTDENGKRTLSIYAKQYSDSLDANVYRRLDMVIDNFNGVGEYNVGSGTNNYLTIAYKLGSIHTFKQVNNVPDMKVVITKADGSDYEGTFQFDTKDVIDANSKISVTNGQFKLKK